MSAALRAVADLLDGLEALPKLNVDVRNADASPWNDGRTEVCIWMEVEEDPRVRFPAVARVALQADVEWPTFSPGLDPAAPEGSYAALGEWRGMKLLVMTACRPTDPNRVEDATPFDDARPEGY
ncbi:hypothetical protein ABT160_07940 [Streptomyces sp. NPDC001941]|uniref:hypothetical protein n=1 Tax=Streptomyces sp. NPDC001941 TaxID=3154659 RepID=UPI003321C0FD